MAGISWFVARRYLTARRRQAFISLISGVSILGVGVGVMALIIALALMTGVQAELRDRIVGATAHVYVTGPFLDFDSARKRLQVPGVTGISPAIIGYGLLAAPRSEPKFATIKGIDTAHEPEVTDLRPSLVTGSIDALVNRPPDAKDGVLLGVDLAKELGVSVGDELMAVTSDLVSTPFGPAPHSRKLQVVGTFRYGFYEVDEQYAYVSMRTAEELLGHPDGPDIMQLRLANMDQAPEIRDRLQKALGPDFDVRDWRQENASLYSALSLEKLAISLTIGLIVMVAALNIVASLVLLVMEKTRDIAILRTMGARAATIRRIFMYQGLAIGLAGTGLGTVLGLAVSLVADRYRLIPLRADVYQISYLPFRVQPLDVAAVVISAVAICLAATLYPSRQAG